MIMNISGEVDQGCLESLIKNFNSLNEKEKIILYLNTGGGESEYACAIIDVINQNCDIIEIVGYNELFSSGFDIFFKSKCHKLILNGTIGMYHLGYVNIDINENARSKDSYNKAIHDFMKSEKQNTMEFCKSLGMSQKEIKNISKGEEQYFQHKRMVELLNYQKLNGQSYEYIH